ncbi:MAG: hypothetical protein WC498_01775 [Candidatus Saccharimonadales bacterium]
MNLAGLTPHRPNMTPDERHHIRNEATLDAFVRARAAGKPEAEAKSLALETGKRLLAELGNVGTLESVLYDVPVRVGEQRDLAPITDIDNTLPSVAENGSEIEGQTF